MGKAGQDDQNIYKKILALSPKVQSEWGSNVKSLTLTGSVERRQLTSSTVWWRGNPAPCQQQLVILRRWRAAFKLCRVIFFFVQCLMGFKAKPFIKKLKKKTQQAREEEGCKAFVCFWLPGVFIPPLHGSARQLGPPCNHHSN